LSIPRDIDGKVIKDIFCIKSSVHSREVELRDPIGRDFDKEPLKVDKESIKNKLEALGYL